MKELSKLINQQLLKMCETGMLFTSTISGQSIWSAYMNGFQPGDNPVFRDPSSSYHNCNLCNNNIRRYGNIIAFDSNGKIMTLWDVEIEGKYKAPTEACAKLIRSGEIQNVFVETINELNYLPYEKIKRGQNVYQLGVPQNVKIYTPSEAAVYGVVTEGIAYTFNHFNLQMPAAFIFDDHRSVGQILGEFEQSHQVLSRGLSEITAEALELAVEFIQNDVLLNGKTYLNKVQSFLALKEKYDQASNKNLFVWNHVTHPLARFKNELIGVTCHELSAVDRDLTKICLDFNKRVDPINYKKAKAPISEKQKADAIKFLQENNFEASFVRRCATMEDINAHEIMHMNVPAALKQRSIFDSVPTKKVSKKQDFSNVPEVSIQEFLEQILPNCSEVKAYFDNIHEKNLVTMTTATDPSSRSIFPWGNNFSWTYKGGLAGKSQIKEAVKAAGGFVDSPFRFSIMWNEDGLSNMDLDAHAKIPDSPSNHIFFGRKKSIRGGELDVDVQRPGQNPGVENIYWYDVPNITANIDFYVHNYSGCKFSGCRAELHINGDTYQYHVPNEWYGNQKFATVVLNLGKVVDIIHHVKPNTSTVSKEVFGIETQQFHNVKLMCKSPNHWDGKEIGNLHYFFMLDGCKSDEKIRSFHNENLIGELMPHRSALEFFGNAISVESTDNQVSGLGFNATVRDTLVVNVTMNGTKKMYKINF